MVVSALSMDAGVYGCSPSQRRTRSIGGSSTSARAPREDETSLVRGESLRCRQQPSQGLSCSRYLDLLATGSFAQCHGTERSLRALRTDLVIVRAISIASVGIANPG